MVKTYIQPGDVCTFVAPADVKSGDVVTVGSLTGIATYSAKQGAEVEVALVGVFELPKASGALAQGALAYWDGSKVIAGGGGGVELNAAPAPPSSGSGADEQEEGDGLLLGAVILPAGADAPTCRVRLNGIAAAPAAAPEPAAPES